MLKFCSKYSLDTHFDSQPTESQVNLPLAPDHFSIKRRKKRRIYPEDTDTTHTVELAVFVDRTLYKYIGKRFPNNNKSERTVEIVMTLVNAVRIWEILYHYNYKWRPPSPSELTPMISNTRLTHLGSEAFIYL